MGWMLRAKYTPCNLFAYWTHYHEETLVNDKHFFSKANFVLVWRRDGCQPSARFQEAHFFEGGSSRTLCDGRGLTTPDSKGLRVSEVSERVMVIKLLMRRSWGPSLGAQWLRPQLQVAGVHVRSLVGKPGSPMPFGPQPKHKTEAIL